MVVLALLALAGSGCGKKPSGPDDRTASVRIDGRTRDFVIDSCGIDGVEVWPVRRVYVTPEAWDSPGAARVLDEVEHWCFACLSHYPHEPADA